MALRRIAKMLLILTVLLVVLLTGLYFYLFHYYMPRNFRDNILPRLTRDAGITGFSGEVRSVGAFGADLGSLVIGDQKAPALTVRSVKVKYRFSNIFLPKKLQINEVILNGVELSCRVRDNRLFVNDVDLDKFIDLLKNQLAGSEKASSQPFADAALTITGGILKLDWNGTRFMLPFELVSTPVKSDWTVFDTKLEVMWKEHKFVIESVFNLGGKQAEIKISARAGLDRLMEWFEYFNQYDLPKDLKLTGDADFDGSLRIGLNPLRMIDVKLTGTVPDGEIEYGKLLLRNRELASGRKVPVRFELTRKERELRLQVYDVFCRKPFPLGVNGLNIFVSDDRAVPVALGGELELDLKQIKALRLYHVKPLSDLVVKRRFEGSYNRLSNEWTFKTLAEYDEQKKQKPQDCVMNCDGTNIVGSISELDFSGKGIGMSGQAVFSGVCSQVTAVGRDMVLFVPESKFSTGLQISVDSHGDGTLAGCNYNFSQPEVFYSTGNARMKVGNFNTTGAVTFSPDGEINVLSGKILLGSMDYTDNKSELVASNVKLEFDTARQGQSSLHAGHLQFSFDSVKGNDEQRRFDFQAGNVKSYVEMLPAFDRIPAIRKMNGRLVCKKGFSGSQKEKITFAELNLGVSLDFEEGGKLISKSLTGSVDSIALKYGNFDIEAWKIDILGSFLRNGETGEKGSGINLFERFEVGKLTMSRNSLKLVSSAASWRIDGKIPKNGIMPSELKSVVFSPSAWLIADDFKGKIDNLELSQNINFSSAVDWISAIKTVECNLKAKNFQGNNAQIAVSGSNVAVGTKMKTIPADGMLKVSSIAMKAGAASLSFSSGGWSTQCGLFVLGGNGERDENGKLVLEPDIEASQLNVNLGDLNLKFPSVKIAGQFDEKAYAGTVTIPAGTGKLNKSGIEFSGIKLSLPVAWPDLSVSSPGTLSVADITYKTTKLGAADINISATGNELFLRGNIASTLISGAGVFYLGRVAMPPKPLGLELEFELPEMNLAEPLKLGLYFPEYDGIAVGGGLSAKGILKAGSDGLSGNCRLQFNNTDLDSGIYKVRGISGVCNLEDMINLKSQPHQKVSFRHFEFGNINLDNGTTVFQIESPESLYVESTVFDWLGGQLASVRPFKLGTADELTFSGKKIMLASLLSFLGVTDVRAGGTVSGQIPVAVSSGSVTFNGASLATVSGDEGNVKISGLEKFKNDSPEKSKTEEMKFTQAVLRDWDYNWMRVDFSTSPKVMLVRLQTEGSPVKPVPFTYNEINGRFRDAAPGEIGIGGGMSIDVDFRIPDNGTR